MIWAVSLSIIRSPALYTQQYVYVVQVTPAAWGSILISFFSTYGVSFGPLEVGYKATRVFDSG